MLTGAAPSASSSAAGAAPTSARSVRRGDRRHGRAARRCSAPASGSPRNPDAVARARIDRRSRAVIFLGPALLFIFATLVVPTIRTIYLSLLDDDTEELVGLDNYIDTFQDKASWNPSNWTNMFTSRLFLIGVVLLAVAVVVGVDRQGRTGRAVEIGNPTDAAAARRCACSCVRRLHHHPRHDRQQPLVGRHGRVPVDGDGPRHRRARRPGRSTRSSPSR